MSAFADDPQPKYGLKETNIVAGLNSTIEPVRASEHYSSQDIAIGKE